MLVSSCVFCFKFFSSLDFLKKLLLFFYLLFFHRLVLFSRLFCLFRKYERFYFCLFIKHTEKTLFEYYTTKRTPSRVLGRVLLFRAVLKRQKWCLRDLMLFNSWDTSWHVPVPSTPSIHLPHHIRNHLKATAHLTHQPVDHVATKLRENGKGTHVERFIYIYYLFYFYFLVFAYFDLNRKRQEKILKCLSFSTVCVSPKKCCVLDYIVCCVGSM